MKPLDCQAPHGSGFPAFSVCAPAWCHRAAGVAALILMGLCEVARGQAETGPATNPPPQIDPELVARWDAAYQNGRRPSWDIGRPSSELKRLVEERVLRPCRVIELGCGTGANAVYLASQGFEVTAIDVAPTALRLAEEQAQAAGVNVRWIHADVLNPPPLEPFDLIFDRGCYHGVRRQNASRYVEVVAELCRPDGRILILAGNANEPRGSSGPPRVDEPELIDDFASGFDFVQLKEIRFDRIDPNEEGPLAWSVLLRRKATAQPASPGSAQD